MLLPERFHGFGNWMCRLLFVLISGVRISDPVRVLYSGISSLPVPSTSFLFFQFDRNSVENETKLPQILSSSDRNSKSYELSGNG